MTSINLHQAYHTLHKASPLRLCKRDVAFPRIDNLYLTIQYTTSKMKFSTAILFGLASTASAFAPATPLNLSAGRSSSRHVSSLQMVADDAKVCLVTGASRGLGASIALELGKQGQKVVVNYAGSEDKALAVVEEIKAAGGDAIAVQADCKLWRSLCSLHHLFVSCCLDLISNQTNHVIISLIIFAFIISMTQQTLMFRR